MGVVDVVESELLADENAPLPRAEKLLGSYISSGHPYFLQCLTYEDRDGAGIIFANFSNTYPFDSGKKFNSRPDYLIIRCVKHDEDRNPRYRFFADRGVISRVFSQWDYSRLVCCSIASGIKNISNVPRKIQQFIILPSNINLYRTFRIIAQKCYKLRFIIRRYSPGLCLDFQRNNI